MYYFCFDVETTGKDCNVHEILQLAAILIDDKFNEIARGQLRLLPEHPDTIQQEALNVNGINLATWKPTHKTSKEAFKKMYNFVYNNIPEKSKVGMLGHNVSFDIGFLEESLKRNDMPFYFRKQRTLDTMQMAQMWSLINNKTFDSYKLANLCQSVGVELNNAHDAMADITATLALAKFFIDDIKEQISGIRKLPI